MPRIQLSLAYGLLLLLLSWPSAGYGFTRHAGDFAWLPHGQNIERVGGERQDGGRKDQQHQGRAGSASPPDEKYGALADRDIWITFNPKGKDIAGLVEERLKSAGMNVMLDPVEMGEQHDWDGDLDYEAKDQEIAALVQELISDIYQMNLAIAEQRSIPNIQITPPP